MTSSTTLNLMKMRVKLKDNHILFHMSLLDLVKELQRIQNSAYLNIHKEEIIPMIERKVADRFGNNGIRKITIVK